MWGEKMPDLELNFEDRAYWDKISEEYCTRSIGVDGSDYGTYWSEYEDLEETEAVWKYFKYCLKTQNRFFFDHPLIPLIVKHFQKHVYVLPKDTEIYRARIDKERKYAEQCWLAKVYISNIKNTGDDNPFAEDYREEAAKIAADPKYQEFVARHSEGFEGFDAQGSGAPPYHTVPAGRCNPERVVFLYASNDEHTATAEVRPYISDAISIAKLSVKKDLKLVDFYFEYDEIGGRCIDNWFFDKIREEFSLLNKGDKDEYLITQYLSLLAHRHGYDGIRFKSSLVEQGENYVIFDAEICPPISSKMYILRKVEYDLFTMILPEEKELIQ